MEEKKSEFIFSFGNVENNEFKESDDSPKQVFPTGNIFSFDDNNLIQAENFSFSSNYSFNSDQDNNSNKIPLYSNIRSKNTLKKKNLKKKLSLVSNKNKKDLPSEKTNKKDFVYSNKNFENTPNNDENEMKPTNNFEISKILKTTNLEGIKELFSQSTIEINSLKDTNETYIPSLFMNKNISKEMIEYLINQKNLDINFKDEMNQSPLHILISHNEIDLNLIKFMIEKKSQVNQKNNFDSTPLQLLLEREFNLETIQFAVEQKIVINTMNPILTPLDIYFNKNCSDIEILKYLIEIKSDLNRQNNFSSSSPLHYAIKASQPSLEVIKLLIKNRAVINSVDKKGKNALYYSLKGKLNQISTFLIEKLADVNSIYNKKKTPLFIAIKKRSDISIIKMLIDYKADINHLSSERIPPIFFCCYVNPFPEYIIKILIENKANLNVFTSNSVLHLAIEKKASFNLICSLIENKSDLNFENHNSLTPLHFFTQEGCFSNEVLSCMLEHKADLNSGFNNETPLHIACNFQNSFYFVKFFVDNKSDLNFAMKKNNCTPLHRASLKSVEIDTIKYLVENKSDVNLLDKSNHNSLLLHCNNLKASLSVVTYLIDKKVDINQVNRSKENALVLLSKKKLVEPEIITFLIESKININQLDNSNNFLRHLFEKRSICQNFGFIKYLLDCNCSLSVNDKYSHHPTEYIRFFSKELAIIILSQQNYFFTFDDCNNPPDSDVLEILNDYNQGTLWNKDRNYLFPSLTQKSIFCFLLSIKIISNSLKKIVPRPLIMIIIQKSLVPDPSGTIVPIKTKPNYYFN